MFHISKADTQSVLGKVPLNEITTYTPKLKTETQEIQ
jgi:hypothetical protein